MIQHAHTVTNHDQEYIHTSLMKEWQKQKGYKLRQHRYEQITSTRPNYEILIPLTEPVSLKIAFTSYVFMPIK
jgi:hypothetical protein